MPQPIDSSASALLNLPQPATPQPKAQTPPDASFSQALAKTDNDKGNDAPPHLKTRAERKPHTETRPASAQDNAPQEKPEDNEEEQTDAGAATTPVMAALLTPAQPITAAPFLSASTPPTGADASGQQTLAALTQLNQTLKTLLASASPPQAAAMPMQGAAMQAAAADTAGAASFASLLPSLPPTPVSQEALRQLSALQQQLNAVGATPMQDDTLTLATQVTPVLPDTGQPAASLTPTPSNALVQAAQESQSLLAQLQQRLSAAPAPDEAATALKQAAGQVQTSLQTLMPAAAPVVQAAAVSQAAGLPPVKPAAPVSLSPNSETKKPTNAPAREAAKLPDTAKIAEPEPAPVTPKTQAEKPVLEIAPQDKALTARGEHEETQDAAAGDSPPTPAFALPSDTVRPAGTNYAAPAQAAAPAPANPADQLVAHVKTAVANGESRIQIQLSPGDLGRLDIRVHIAADGQTKLSVTADSERTLSMLRSDVQSMEKMLTDVGLKTDSGSLSFHLRDEGGQAAGQQFAGQQSSGQGQNGQGRSYRGQPVIDPLEEALSTTAARAYAITAPEGVDIRI